MYEKPQYLTPEGYRRRSKNPYKKKILKKASPAKKRISPNKFLSLKEFNKNAQRGISDEAAKLIAQAIKGLLRE